MIKMKKTILSPALMAIILMSNVFATNLWAMADRQAFAGAGLGFNVLSKDGSGTGLYFRGEGGYRFVAPLGVGLHVGYSNIGGVGIKTLDFGSFVQATELESGIYGRCYLDAVYASIDGGGKMHGVKDSQLGFAPGLGMGVVIPTAGDFHMVPEVTYRIAFLEAPVNLISASFNLMWDF